MQLIKALTYLLFISSHCLAQKKELSFDQVFADSPANISRPLPDIVCWIDDDHYLERKDESGKTVFLSVEAKTGNAIPYESPAH